MVFAVAVDGAEEEEEVRAEAIGASDVTGWWMGSRRRRERRALAAEAAVAPPLHMAAAGAGCGDDEARWSTVGMGIRRVRQVGVVSWAEETRTQD
jgi:hypothetical protein